MSNIKFVYEGIEGCTPTASAGTATGYDVENVANRNPNSKWKSGATTNNQTLEIVLAAARAVDTVVIDGHNMSAAATSDLDLAVEYSDNGSTWIVAESKSLSDLSAILVYEFGAVAKQYWRIRFSQNNGAFAVHPIVGNIFIGTRFELPFPYDSAIERGESYTTISTRALDGTLYTAQKLVDGIETWKNIKWGNISNALANGFIALNSGVRGSGRPFYFVETDSTIRLVTLVGDAVKISPKRYNINDVQIEMRALLANTISGNITVPTPPLSGIIMSDGI